MKFFTKQKIGKRIIVDKKIITYNRVKQTNSIMNIPGCRCLRVIQIKRYLQ